MFLGIDRDGCSLSGVSARCHWEERKVTSKTGSAWRSPEAEDDDDDSSSQDEEEDETEAGATLGRHRPTPADGEPINGEIWPIRRLYKGVHLTLNLEAASLLPVVLRYSLQIDIFVYLKILNFLFQCLSEVDFDTIVILRSKQWLVKRR
jgi:hypothetical protein